MSLSTALVIGISATLALYALAVVALLAVGKRSDARALAGLIPDCTVLFGRLLRDSRVPRRRKLLVIPLLGYLVLPIDLIPDFIPVAGQLDDAILAALVLRVVVRGGGGELFDEHWPGPPQSAALIKRLAIAPSG